MTSSTTPAPGPDRVDHTETESSGHTSPLHSELVGGAVLLLAAVAALVWANSPWASSYQALTETVVGPSALNLDLSLSTWAADGLLAVFFFVVGLELKSELVTGSLRDPRAAALPMLGAVGGMAVPAALYVGVQLVGGGDELDGWAIPVATDIAFALAVLAVFGRGLPLALRTFLLTLAVVDDLLAITIIAVFYSSGLDLLFLAASLVVVAVFAAVLRRTTAWWVLLPVGAVAWTLMHEAGVHATVAGVLLGFAVPALARDGEHEALTHRFEHRVRPVSQLVALPLFAFLASGVVVGGAEGLRDLVTDPLSLGILAGLVLGKVVGIWGTTALVVRLSPLRLDPSLRLFDVLPVAFLAGIGFTVSLLISELAFTDPLTTDSAKLAVLVASTVSALLAATTLRQAARRAGRATQAR